MADQHDLFNPPGHGHDAEEHGDEHESHGGTGLYLTVFAALCVLTAISFGSYYAFHSMPKVSWAVMMAVSCMKALLVIMFFMHLLWEANWKYVLTFPAMFMSIFLGLMLVPDVGQRMYHYNYNRMIYAAEPVVEGASHSTDHGPAAGDAADKSNSGKHTEDKAEHQTEAAEKAAPAKPEGAEKAAGEPQPEGQKQDAGAR